MFFINPFIYGGAGGDFESIATVTVGSGGAANVEFTSIPSTYQHLQIRAVFRSARSEAFDANLYMQVNGDTGNNYNAHDLTGSGSSASASSGGTGAQASIGYGPTNGRTASAFGGIVLDILDYGSTTKNKTMRSLSGYDANGTGIVALSSGLWMSTSAVTSLKFFIFSYNLVQHSTFALYGVKAP
jgi:hypothetical protein